MALTLKEAKSKSMALIAAVSNGGIKITDAENADYLLRAIPFFDQAQKQIAQYSKIHAVKHISRYPETNLLGDNQTWDMIRHANADLSNTICVGGQAYYFEVDNPATIYIEEEVSGVWTVRDTITVPESVTSFTAYKGVISLDSVLNSVRMRFSGSYPYSIRNRAFYANLYASASKVPDYTPYVTYTMPSDFFEIDKVINTTDNQIYNDTLDYRRVGRREIVFSYDTKGEIDAHYFKYPVNLYDQDTVTVYTDTASAGAFTYITFPVGASTEDKAYSGMTLTISAGTGSGQTAVIIDYNGTTRQAYPQIPFTTAPDNTSVFTITKYTNEIYYAEVYDESAEAIPYYMAGMMYLDEYPSLSQELLAQYRDRLVNATTKQDSGFQIPLNSSGW